MKVRLQWLGAVLISWPRGLGSAFQDKEGR